MVVDVTVGGTMFIGVDGIVALIIVSVVVLMLQFIADSSLYFDSWTNDWTSRCSYAAILVAELQPAIVAIKCLYSCIYVVVLV